jgi:cytoplasmic iron level regulating protein YaaA (DUF328/UPF0246 family)
MFVRVCGVVRGLFEQFGELSTNHVSDSMNIKIELVRNVSKYEKFSKERLPKMLYDCYAYEAEDHWTLKENREAFSRIL